MMVRSRQRYIHFASIKKDDAIEFKFVKLNIFSFCSPQFVIVFTRYEKKDCHTDNFM